MRSTEIGSQETIIRYAHLADANVPRTAHPNQPRSWLEDGVYVAPWKMPETLMDSYSALRSKVGPAGWTYPTPYLHYRELRELCLYEKLVSTAHDLMSTPQPVGLHLNLTGWVSTERDLHSDSYLNPSGVDDNYLACWIALEDIHPDSGPFQYVAGSHLWPVITREKLFSFLTNEEQADPAWPGKTQTVVARACFEEMAQRGATLTTYLPKRGDVLFWHSYLIHRGSPPNQVGMPRRACIAHYSGINVRPDMTMVTDPVTGNYMAQFPHELPPNKSYPEKTV